MSSWEQLALSSFQSDVTYLGDNTMGMTQPHIPVDNTHGLQALSTEVVENIGAWTGGTTASCRDQCESILVSSRMSVSWCSVHVSSSMVFALAVKHMNIQWPRD